MSKVIRPIFLPFLLLTGFCLPSHPVKATEVEANATHVGERAHPSEDPLKKRIASLFLSQTFLNEQIAVHLIGSDLVKSLKLDLNADENKIRVQGKLQLPMDDLESMGIDEKMTQFIFQLTISPHINKDGYLVLEFPLRKTFFYQASSTNPEKDRVMIPVQLLSLGLAATRGYLSALSGDFSSFDRKKSKLRALLAGTKRILKEEANSDAKALLKTRIRSLELEIEQTTLQKEQFEQTSKNLANLIGSGEDEGFNLNNQIKAQDNSLFLKLKLENLVPYLKNVDLGSIRLTRRQRYGEPENFFVMDIYANMITDAALVERPVRAPQRKLQVPPSIIIRMNQEVFKSTLVMDKKKAAMGDRVEDFKVLFEDDGVHVTGKVKLWFFRVPFDKIVDFVAAGPDVFEIRLRRFEVWGMSLKFLIPIALDAIKERLDSVLQGVFTYEYLGKKEDSKALRVSVDSAKLIPAFPELHLVDVGVRDRSLVMYIGRTAKEQKQFEEEQKTYERIMEKEL